MLISKYRNRQYPYFDFTGAAKALNRQQKIFKLCYIVALLLCLSKVSLAQTDLSYIPQAFPKSPNVAAQDRYGDYQVNHYSGVPAINIPIYTVQSGELKVPISVSYHAAGIKVNDVSGSVGLGWSLNAGGRVSRTVIGQADENGYFKSAFQGGYRSPSSLSPYVNSDFDYLFNIGMNRDGYDSRPDIFAYDLPGHSGKFVYNAKENYTIKFIPFAPLKVVSPLTAPLKYTITDENGNVFKLGYATSEITGTASYSEGTRYATTAWMLEQMLSQNRRDTIAFNYKQQVVYPADQVGQVAVVEDMPAAGTCNLPGIGDPQIYNTVTSYTVTQQDIQRITFKNGYVDFILSDKRGAVRQDIRGQNNSIYSLDSIKVYALNFASKKYELQRAVQFVSSYFTNGLVEKRLRLDAIRFFNKAGNLMQKYAFTYDGQNLPSYNSYSRDYWGYYNGKMDGSVANKTLIPRTTADVIYLQSTTPKTFGADTYGTREPDTLKMQAGVLKRIDFPTGGHTDFAYETNRYYDNSNAVHLTGGLRVKTVSTYDLPGDVLPIVRTYVYNTAQANFLTDPVTGVMSYGYVMRSAKDKVFRNGPGMVELCYSKRVRTYLSEPSNNLTGTEGNPVAYTTVTEYLGTPFNNAGKSVYQYSFQANEWSGSAATTRMPIMLDYFFKRGLLLNKSDYLRKQNGTYQLVKETVNDYFAFGTQLLTDIGMAVGNIENTGGAISKAYSQSTAAGQNNEDMNRFPYTAYSMVTGDNYLKSSTVKTFDLVTPSAFTAVTTNHSYGNIKHQQITRSSIIDSKGAILVSVKKYPADFLSGNNTSSGNAVLDSMLSRNMQASMVETWDSVKYASADLNAVKSAQLFFYSLVKGNMGAVVPDQIKKLKTAVLGTNFMPAYVNAGNIIGDSAYEPLITFDSYDEKNNMTRYTPRNSPPVAMIWDYQRAMPVAEVKNVGAYNAGYTGFEVGSANSLFNYADNGAVVDVTAPEGKRSYKLTAGNINCYNMSPGTKNILSYWSDGAPATVYCNVNIVGSAMRHFGKWTLYQHIVPQGVSSVATISGTTAIDGLRIYPADAQMTSYAYGPDGVTEEEDANGKISHYEYDFYQRLMNVRDWKGNIIKNASYHVFDMTIGNDAMSASFTRNNCPYGTTPQSTNYVVPASLYYGVTKELANADAAFDLALNGQKKANDPAVCGCAVQMISFPLSNTTGLNGYQVTFTGTATYVYDVPAGSTSIAVPVGTYTVSINPVGTYVKNFKVGNRTPVNGHNASFSNVLVNTGSSDLGLSIY